MRNILKLITILIIIQLLSVRAYSQEVIKTLFGQYKEKYVVSIGNNEVKDGLYEVFRNEKLVIKGQYSNNQKSGLWTVYSSKQDTEFVYNYDLNLFECWKCQEQFQDCKDKKRPAFCVDGFQFLYSQIALKVIYPKSAVLYDKKGTSTVTVVIDRNGQFSDCSLSRSTGFKDLDREAVIAVRNICSKSNWFPAVDNNNLPMDDKINFTINFILK